MATPSVLNRAFLLHVLEEWKRNQRVSVLTATSPQRALGGSISRSECELILARLCDDGLLVQAWSSIATSLFQARTPGLSKAGQKLVDAYRADRDARPETPDRQSRQQLGLVPGVHTSAAVLFKQVFDSPFGC